MIRICVESDFDAIHAIINDAATAYRGVIPDDRWHDPYMTREHLAGEIADGVVFRGLERDGKLLGVMGIQTGEVMLIHAYVRTGERRGRIGAVSASSSNRRQPVLVGTGRGVVTVDFTESGLKVSVERDGS